MSRQVIIDKINIRLPNGWQGDPNILARRLAEQIQQQAAELQSANSSISACGDTYAEAGKQVAEQLGSEQLTTQHRTDQTRRRSR